MTILRGWNVCPMHGARGEAPEGIFFPRIAASIAAPYASAAAGRSALSSKSSLNKRPNRLSGGEMGDLAVVVLD
jgi:hypothetical protein